MIKSRFLLTFAIVFTVGDIALLAENVKAKDEFLIEDDFSRSSNLSELLGSMTSDGQTTYSGFISVDSAGKARVEDKKVVLQANAPVHLSFVKLNWEVGASSEFEVRVDGFSFSKAIPGSSFFLAARTSVSLGYGYQFVANDNGELVVEFASEENAQVDPVGLITATEIKNIVLKVGPTTQRLFVNGEPFDKEERPTALSGSAGDPQYIVFALRGPAAGEEMAEATFDRLEVKGSMTPAAPASSESPK